MPATISRAEYAAMYGPTTGDKVRLADTDLIIEVERDLTALRAGASNAPIYGEEVKFGGGKVIRDGMGQSQMTRAQGAVDTVITNALIVDHTGIYKADVGLKDGRILKIGKLSIQMIHGVTHPEPEIGRYLIIPRPRRMKPPCRIADQLTKPRLHMHVNVLQRRIGFEIPRLNLTKNCLQPVLNLFTIFL